MQIWRKIVKNVVYTGCHFPLRFYWSSDFWALRAFSTDVNMKIVLRIFLSTSVMNATFGNRGIFALRSIEIDAYRKSPLKSFEPTRVICIRFHLSINIRVCLEVLLSFPVVLVKHSNAILLGFKCTLEIFITSKSNNFWRFLSTSVRYYFVREIIEGISPRFEFTWKCD